MLNKQVFMPHAAQGYWDGLSKYSALMGMKQYVDPSGLPGSWWNPLNWPGLLLENAGGAIASTNVPVISGVGRVVQGVGEVATAPGNLIQAGVTFDMAPLSVAVDGLGGGSINIGLGTVTTVGQTVNLPNTVIGLAIGGTGELFGGGRVDLGHNAVQFHDNLFMPFGAITLGNVIIYGRGAPELIVGDHEEQHTYQGQILGPLYLPAHIILGTISWIIDSDWHGPINVLETGPQDNCPHPWPWQ